VKGIVENPTATTINIGIQVVNIPAGTVVTAGQRVEVEGTLNALGQLVATTITVEAAEDAAFVPAAGQEFHVEGYISGFVSATQFNIGTTPASTTAATVFIGGTAADLSAVPAKAVRAEGVMTGGVLVAREITFLTAL
ncbi:MAG: hypothetical protein HZA16_13900, partial [Nitrospirae bacterium]|nr:hypothetical protein [Nitrospirota bacterium]